MSGLRTRDARQRFREAARAQRCCQVPGCPKPTAGWHAHHVLLEQHVAEFGVHKWEPRNALRLCVNCHFAHHRRLPTLTTRALSDAHLDFMREVLGERAADYLRTYYDATGDPRL